MPAPRGYGVARLDLRRLEWMDAEADRDAGLYRYDAVESPAFRLLDGDAVYAVGWAIGAWAALSRWRYTPVSSLGT